MNSPLVCTEKLVLPDSFRPALPPGAQLRIPDSMPQFNPALPEHPLTRQVFDSFFKQTRTTAGLNPHTAEHAAAHGTDTGEPVDLGAPVEPDSASSASNDSGDGNWSVDDDGKMYYLNLVDDGELDGGYLVVDANGDPLVDEDGQRLYADADGYLLPKKQRWWQKLAGKLDGNTADSDDTFVVYDKNGAPIGDFDVVAPGKAPTDRRGARGVRALSLLCTAGMAVACVGFVGGAFLGRSAVPAAGQITPAEASAYNLSQFPVDGGVAFAKQYLELCLTHPKYKEDTQKRTKMMEGMAVNGVAPSCGWEEGGAVGGPSSITFNGQVETRKEYTSGKVAYLGFSVTMQDDRNFTATVPVWAGENSAGRQAYSIVGDIGMTGATALNLSPDMTVTNYMADRKNVATIQPTVEAFFDAWGQSNARGLAAVTTADATGEARQGLDGTVSSPKIDRVVILPSRKPDSSQGDSMEWNYVDGDEVTAMVALTWQVKDSSGGHKQPAGYRLTMKYQSGKWSVSALHSGVVVPSGDPGKNSNKGDAGVIGGDSGISGGFGTAGELSSNNDSDSGGGGA